MSFSRRGGCGFSRVGLRKILEKCDRNIGEENGNYSHFLQRSSVRLLLGDCRAGWRDLMRAYMLSPRYMANYSEGQEAASRNAEISPSPFFDAAPFVNRLDRVLLDDAGSAIAWAWRGMLKRRLRDYKGAVDDFDRAMALGIRSAMVLTLRGEARLQIGDRSGMKDMERALTRPCQAWNFAWCGRAKLNFERSPSALRYLDRSIEVDPEDGWHYAWRAESKRLLGLTKGMFDDFDSALERESGTGYLGFVRTWRGLALLQVGRPQEAINDFDRAIAAMPSYALAFSGRARAYRRLGRRIAWFEDFQEAARLDAKHRNFAYSCSREELRALISDMDCVIRHRKKRSDALGWRAFFLTLLKRTPEALADFKRAIALDPKNPWAYAWRAQLFYQLGKREPALKDLRRALLLDPTILPAYDLSAKINLQMGVPRVALRYLDRAIKIDPRYAAMFADRGRIKLILGDASGAVHDLERAINLDPSYAIAYTDLAVALGRNGNILEERKTLERAVALDKVSVQERLRIWAGYLNDAGEKMTATHRGALNGLETAA